MHDGHRDNETGEQTNNRRKPARRGDPDRSGLGGLGWALLGATVAVGVVAAQGFLRSSRGQTTGRGAAKGWGQEPEVERSITIQRPAEELYQAWRDPATVPRIMGFLADIRPTGDGRSKWRVKGPLGQSYSWGMQITEERPGELIRATAHEGDALVTESEIRFRPAPGDRGTIATLRVRFDPPGGMLGDVAARFFHGIVPKELASKALRYFHSLVLTGEIPTTDRQPAARPDPR